jgi:hypothetical protein
LRRRKGRTESKEEKKNEKEGIQNGKKTKVRKKIGNTRVICSYGIPFYT